MPYHVRVQYGRNDSQTFKTGGVKFRDDKQRLPAHQPFWRVVVLGSRAHGLLRNLVGWSRLDSVDQKFLYFLPHGKRVAEWN